MYICIVVMLVVVGGGVYVWAGAFNTLIFDVFGGVHACVCARACRGMGGCRRAQRKQISQLVV